MRAVVFRRPKKVSLEDWKDPEIEHPRDAIVRVTSTAICGSDLHIYNGLLPQLKPMVLGHEFMGIVEEVGDDVTNLRSGDRVVVPFPIADGTCWFCTHGFPTHCEASNPEKYGPDGGVLKEKGAGLFGYTDLYGGYDGGQAERVRVPFADYGPRRVPTDLPDERLLLLTDVVPTAWTAVKWGGVKEGDTVAVMGCGPVGLLAQRIAGLKGARVLAVDLLEYRLAKARDFAGSETVDASREDAVEAIRGFTEGRGADVVIDAVGMEAERSILEKATAVVHVQRGTMKVLMDSIRAVRRGGVVSVVGVYGTPFDNFPVGAFFDKGLTLRGGQAPVHEVIDEALPLVVDGRIRPEEIITHRLPLEEAPHAYEIFNRKDEECVKVVLNP